MSYRGVCAHEPILTIFWKNLDVSLNMRTSEAGLSVLIPRATSNNTISNNTISNNTISNKHSNNTISNNHSNDTISNK